MIVARWLKLDFNVSPRGQRPHPRINCPPGQAVGDYVALGEPLQVHNLQGGPKYAKPVRGYLKRINIKLKDC